MDNFVDKSAVSVDKSVKTVDNFVDNFWLEKSYPQENRLIHISSTDLSTGKINVCDLFLIIKIKLSTENALPNNNNLLNIYKIFIYCWSAAKIRSCGQAKFYFTCGQVGNRVYPLEHGGDRTNRHTGELR